MDKNESIEVTIIQYYPMQNKPYRNYKWSFEGKQTGYVNVFEDDFENIIPNGSKIRITKSKKNPKFWDFIEIVKLAEEKQIVDTSEGKEHIESENSDFSNGVELLIDENAKYEFGMAVKGVLQHYSMAKGINIAVEKKEQFIKEVILTFEAIKEARGKCFGKR